jgi:hypothetical protein
MERELVGKYTMPGIGFRTLGNVGGAGRTLVEAALAEGYRYIDIQVLRQRGGGRERISAFPPASSPPRAGRRRLQPPEADGPNTGKL